MLCLGYLCGIAKASLIKASTFNASGSNQTKCLQAAFDSNYDTVMIDNIGKDWIAGPLMLTRKKMVVIFEKGVTLLALKGAFPKKSDSFLNIIKTENIKIVGNGAAIRMNKEEYWDSDWHAGINIIESDKIEIDNLEISNCGGDGLYIGRWGGKKSCNDIKIANCKIFNNKRHSISVICAMNLDIENCSLYNNQEKASCGIDFEPNYSQEYLQGIRMNNCRIYGNRNTGISCFLITLDGNSPPVDITITNCKVMNNNTGIAFANSKGDGPVGNISIENTTINNSASYGLMISSDPRFTTTLTQCELKANAMSDRKTTTILIDGTYFGKANVMKGKYGGLVFKDCRVEDELSRPLVEYRNASGNRLENVGGTFSYRGPYNINAGYGAKSDKLFNVKKL